MRASSSLMSLIIEVLKMKIYLLIHIVDGDSWGVDTDAFLSKEEAQKSMRNFWQTALKEWGIDAESEQNDEQSWECSDVSASISDYCKNEFEHWEIHEKNMDVQVAIKVHEGMVHSVISNAGVDVDVYDLDVSDYPDEGEQDEADKLEKEFNELSNQPGWGDVW